MLAKTAGSRRNAYRPGSKPSTRCSMNSGCTMAGVDSAFHGGWSRRAIRQCHHAKERRRRERGGTVEAHGAAALPGNLREAQIQGRGSRWRGGLQGRGAQRERSGLVRGAVNRFDIRPHQTLRAQAVGAPSRVAFFSASNRHCPSGNPDCRPTAAHRVLARQPQNPHHGPVQCRSASSPAASSSRVCHS